MSLLRKMTYKDKGSYESSPPCIHHVYDLHEPIPVGLIFWRANICVAQLQCVAMCCSVLYCVAVCCSVLQRVAVYYSHEPIPVLRKMVSTAKCLPLTKIERRACQCVAVWCGVLQCVAVCCSVAQDGKHGKALATGEEKERSMSVYCSVLQCVATCCNVLQCCARWWARRSAYHRHSCDYPLTNSALSSFKCVVVCCSVLQCVAVCCGVAQDDEHGKVLATDNLSSILWQTQRYTRLSVLQRVAVCCSVLQFAQDGKHSEALAAEYPTIIFW